MRIAVILGWIIWCSPHTLQAQSAMPEPTRFQFQERHMGTTFSITFYDSNTRHAEATANRVFKRITELNKIFSDYLPESELNKLSETAGSGLRVKVSKELWEVLQTSQRLSSLSEGAFDVTVGPLSKLWRRALRQQQFPTQAQIEKARSKVNYHWIKLYPPHREVELLQPGMRLDLGGIAKGYTVDEIRNILESEQITSFLIDGGGDLMIGGPPPEGLPWSVIGQDGQPLKPGSHQALAASGNTYQHLNWQGKKYSHLVDTNTGIGATVGGVFYVSAPSCMIADGLASAISLMDPRRSKKLLSRFNAQRIYPEAIPEGNTGKL